VQLTRNDVIWAAAIAASWVLASFDLLSPRMAPDNVALVWFPNAVLAVAMLRRIHRRDLVALFCGTALVAAGVAGWLRTGESALGWSVLAIGNCIEAGLLAWAASRVGGAQFTFDRRRAAVVWMTAALTAPLGSMIFAFIAARAGFGPVVFANFPESAFNWMLGDAAAHFTLGALLVSATDGERAQRWARARARPALAGVVLAAVLSSSVFAFVGPEFWNGESGVVHPGYLALVAPALMWAAFVYGPSGAAACSLLALAPGAALTVAGIGPFAQGDRPLVLDLQVMCVAMAGATLLVGVLSATLRAARDRAQDADRAKTLFLSRIGHELRTPLNGVIGAADLLAHDLEDAPAAQQDRLDLVRSSARTLAAVVEDLVEFAAMHREGVSVRPVPFEARRPFDDALAIFAPRAQWNGVALRLEARGLENAWIVSDPARLRQILFALAANAVEATTKGEIIIEATLDAKAEAPASLHVVVRDTGPGIPPEKQADIFAPFRQTETDANRPSPGLGLGLAVAKETTAALGGTITVESAPGEGAAFSFSIPVGVAAAPAAGKAGAGNAHALLAEDNPTSRIVLSAMLTSLGFDVMSVETGVEALAAASRNDFELIVMDIQMPVMDGEEATQRIRALDGPRGRTPIVVVTAHALSGDDRRFIANGANEVVAKPIDLRQLAEAVSRVVTQPEANA